MNLDSQHILVIIPAYNEEASIGSVIRDVREHVPEADILVVNDGSSDRTESCAREAGAKVLTLPYNVGIGGGCKPVIFTPNKGAMTSPCKWTPMASIRPENCED